jgi:hypothetical protein
MTFERAQPPEKISQEAERVNERELKERIVNAIQVYERITGKFVKLIKPKRIETDGRMGSEVQDVTVFTTEHIRDMLDTGLTVEDVAESLCKKKEF